MSAAVIAIANAVVTQLNAATGATTPAISQSFTATLKILPEIDIPSLSALRVFVVARSKDEDRESRSSFLTQYEVDVAIQKHVSDIEADVPGLLQVGDEVDARIHALLEYGSATLERIQTKLLYDVETLRQKQVFMQIKTLHFIVP